MSNTEMTGQRYKGLCRMIYYYALFGSIALACFAVFLAVRAIMSGAADEMWKYIFGAYYCVIFFLSANFIRQIFRRLTDSDSPFRYDIADKMKGAAGVLTAGGAGVPVIYNLLRIFADTLNDPGFGINLSVGVITMLLGMIMQTFALIFEYGCRLQTESDETL